MRHFATRIPIDPDQHASLDLVCLRCEEILCIVKHDTVLDTLALVAADHERFRCSFT